MKQTPLLSTSEKIPIVRLKKNFSSLSLSQKETIKDRRIVPTKLPSTSNQPTSSRSATSTPRNTTTQSEKVFGQENKHVPPTSDISPVIPTSFRPIPVLPCLDFYNSSKEDILSQIQSYINSFGYNYTITPFYRLKKSGGTSHVLEVFQLLSTYGLPIQCVEAVFIGAILTVGWQGSVRIPVCFKSKFASNPSDPSTAQIYRHIVLAVYQDGKWGALGISRRDDLMDKKFEFNSLWELCEEYYRCYANNYHRLLTVYCGFPLPHNFLQDQKIVWKAIKFNMYSKGKGDSDASGDNYVSENIRRMKEFLQPFVPTG